MPHQIDLDPWFDDFLDRLISEGHYPDVSQAIEAGLALLDEQMAKDAEAETEKVIGTPVELPNNPSVATLNTFMDDSLQDLIAMLDEREVEQNDEMVRDENTDEQTPEDDPKPST